MCHEYERLIHKAIDHELSQEEEKQLVAHLQVCPSCKEEYEAFKQLKNWMGQLEESDLPDNFHQTLMQRVNEENEEAEKRRWSKKTNRHFVRSFASVAASLFIGSLVVYQLGKMSGVNKNSSMEIARAADMGAAATEEAPANEALQDESVTYDAHYKVSESAESREEEADSIELENGVQWRVVVADVNAAIDQTINYLDTHQIAYQLAENKVHILNMDQYDMFEEWLLAQGADVKKEQEREQEREQDESITLFFEVADE